MADVTLCSPQEGIVEADKMEKVLAYVAELAGRLAKEGGNFASPPRQMGLVRICSHYASMSTPH
jgi:hypothetical protein